MVRIAPVRLSFNPKTLWFDANGLDLAVGDRVVVRTARGREFGSVSAALFDMDPDEVKNLKSPLKPVERIATDDDIARSDEMLTLSNEALPLFRQLAAETVPDMSPVAVEYLFEGDKAVFYFESEERVDFRDLVRKLASEFHVRVDMKQIGARDGARMVGGLGHCGQELCCRRLGGEFNPVSIRMAKEQDLSLNPQKISGTCGRLMCCLRYEYEAYKDFHSRAPKKNAKIETPEGEGKVVDLDVPREIVSIKVGTEKPVKIPLEDMDVPEEGARPNAVGQEAWDRANEPAMLATDSAFGLFAGQLTGEDQLAKPGQVRHVHAEGDSDETQGKSRSRRRGRSGAKRESGSEPRRKQAAGASDDSSQAQVARKPRRRRSTKVKSDGSSQIEKQERLQAQRQEAGEQKQPAPSSRRRRGRGGRSQGQEQPRADQQAKSKVGRNSSALRSGRSEGTSGGSAAKQSGNDAAGTAQRRRRRTHKAGPSESGGADA